MNIANQISIIRKEQKLTQEEFGKLFYVTRQTVSNWENGKSYPDLQTLVKISNQFAVSLDSLIKEDAKMVEAIDRERVIGTIKKEKKAADLVTSIGTGIVTGCVFSLDTQIRTVAIVIGFILLCIGWYKKEKNDIKMFKYMEEQLDENN